MVLDIDVGPLLQTRKLLTSLLFARAKGYHTNRSAPPNCEMMNLTGDGTGLDMVTMPQAMREQVPTSNFFQRGGYERNPVAIRHNTVAKLLAITDTQDGRQQQSAGRQGTGGVVLAEPLSRRMPGPTSRRPGSAFATLTWPRRRALGAQLTPART